MPTLSKQRFSLARAVILAVDEDWRNVVYNDSNSNATIGVGHMLTQSELSSGKIIINGRGIKWSKGLTDIQVAQLLAQDVAEREAVIHNLVKVPLEQHQFDALLLFVFNIGATAFAGSTLLRKLNEGAYKSIPDQMRRWIYVAGKPSKGLKNRRESEVAVWNNVH